MKKLVCQIFRFGIVGIIAFIVDYSLLYYLTRFLGLYYLISSIISFLVSLVINYILSIKWVFDVKKKQTFRDIVLFIILSTIGLFINSIVIYLSVEFFHIHYMIGKIIATIIVMIWNFVTRKIFIEK